MFSEDSGVMTSQSLKGSRVLDRQTRLRVLLVDDDDGVRSIVTRMLTFLNFDVVDASTPTAALKLAEDRAFDLAVLDVAMPIMSGDQLAGRLRQQHPDLPVLYLTGRSDQLFESRATLWQREAFIDKPATLDGLREAISLLVFGRIGAAD